MTGVNGGHDPIHNFLDMAFRGFTKKAKRDFKKTQMTDEQVQAKEARGRLRKRELVANAGQRSFRLEHSDEGRCSVSIKSQKMPKGTSKLTKGEAEVYPPQDQYRSPSLEAPASWLRAFSTQHDKRSPMQFSSRSVHNPRLRIFYQEGMDVRPKPPRHQQSQIPNFSRTRPPFESTIVGGFKETREPSRYVTSMVSNADITRVPTDFAPIGDNERTFISGMVPQNSDFQESRRQHR